MPTLKELNVKPGDVAVNTDDGMRFEIESIGEYIAYGKTNWSDGTVLIADAWSLTATDTWEIVSRASDATDWSSWHLTPVGGGAPKVGDHKPAGLISDIEVTPLPCGKQYAYRFRVGGAECSPDAPKAWKDMTDEERAPILLAWARGKDIEWFHLQSPDSKWKVTVLSPNQWDGCAYRIKAEAEPEPERVERFFQVDHKSMDEPEPERVEKFFHIGVDDAMEVIDISDARLIVKDYGGYAYRITTDPDGGNATIEEV